MISLSLLVYLSLSLLSSITQPPPIVLCTTTSTTSRDKQLAKSDGLCSTDEIMSQMNLQDWNELEQQGNNPAQPFEVPQLPAQPDEGPLLPLEGLEHQVLENPLPPELQDFLQPPLEELEDQVLLDITQLPAQPAEDPLLPLEGLEHQVLDNPLPPELQDFLQPPLEELEDQILPDIPQLPAQLFEAPQQQAQQPDVPQPPDQVPVLPQPVNQMSTAWDNSRYSPSISGTASNNILSIFTGIAPYLLSSGIASNNIYYSSFLGITPYPLSSGIASNNGHYNPSSTGICWNNNPNPLSARLNPQLPAAQGSVFLQPSQEDGCNVPSSAMTSGNNDGNKDGNNDGRPIMGTKTYRKQRYDHFLTSKKPNLNIEKKIRYQVRKNLSDIRQRKKGRYVSSSEAEPSHRYGLGASDPDDTGSGSGSVIPSTTWCALPTQQNASLQSQELASPNNELGSQVHRQGHEDLIPPNWPNAPSESRDEVATWEQELRSIGFWESDAAGGDDHVPGEDPS